MESAMNDELTECYDLLGLNPGASPEELKVAYRDLTKVWHPDRFLHDPRLQEKAQERSKQINKAYAQLRSGKAKRQTQPPASTNERRKYAQAHAETGSVAVVQRIRWRLILAPVLIFAVVFLATYRSLLRPSEQEDQSQVPAIEQPGSRDNTSVNELLYGTDRLKAKSQREEPASASTSEASVAPLRPLPTITVVIDPYTGMIARPDCPVKSRMTYPSGNEPHQQCNALHPAKKTAPADASGPKDSSLKSVAKRLASPGRWFGDKAKSDAQNKQDSTSP
jgi:hypothetical protein